MVEVCRAGKAGPRARMMWRVASVVNINEVLDGHVRLEVDCVDRLYLNAYVPDCRSAARWSRFLTDHLGFPVRRRR